MALTPKYLGSITCKLTVRPRLGQRPVDSACFSNPQLWYFQPQTPFCGPPVWVWALGGPEPVFWAQIEGPKNMTLWRDRSPHEVSGDCLRGEWFVWYPGTLWVYQFPPNPSQGRALQGFPPNLKIPGAPLGPWVGCLLSLCGPLPYTTPEPPTRVGLYLYKPKGLRGVLLVQ